MATLKTEFLDTNRQQVIHPTGEVVVAGEYTSTSATADTIQLCTLPANAILTSVKVTLIDAAGGTQIALGNSTDGVGVYRASAALTNAKRGEDTIGLPIKYSSSRVITCTFSAPLTGNKQIGYAVTYTTEFAIPGYTAQDFMA